MERKEATASLKRSMGFFDLLSFGVASIMGSGGFNLIGEGVVAGGPLFPAAIGIVTVLFQGASKVYEEAFKKYKSNTSESDMVRDQFGPYAEFATALSILFFNIFSISTILVVAAKEVFPKGQWTGQVSAAAVAAVLMSLFSLQGIDSNKDIVAIFSLAIVALLTLVSSIGLLEGVGFSDKDAFAWPSCLDKTPDFAESILFFYFILAGFDLLMKFVEESKEPEKDIPRAFYISNALSTALTAGVSYAFVHTLAVRSFDSAPKDDAIRLVFETFMGSSTGSVVHWAAIVLMLVTAFVAFLGTTRYLFGIGDEIKTGKYKAADALWGRWLTALNPNKVPVNAVAVTIVVILFGILINHTSKLVKLTDFFLTLVMFSVAAAVTKYRATKGEVPWIESATAIGFFALLTTCCF